MRVVLRNPSAPDGSNYWSLTIGREYEVLGIEGDDYRLLDETGEPFLFDPTCFEVTEAREPDFWTSDCIEDGVRYAYPLGWGVPGFFEAWHDRDEVVQRLFTEQLAYWYPEHAGTSRPRAKANPGRSL